MNKAIQQTDSSGFLRFLFLLIGIGSMSCVAPTGVSLAASTQPATAPSVQSFRDSAGLVELQYPGDWSGKKDPDYVLSLTNGSQLFTLDIPDLPAHIPGLIPLNLVVDGYIDDLRKNHPGIKVVDETAPHISGARSHRILSTWTEKQTHSSEVATLIVHGDHVFILRIVAPADQLPVARTSYGTMIDSLKWLK